MASGYLGMVANSNLAEGIIGSLHSRRCVAVEITNRSKFILRYSGYHCESGYLYSPPALAIAPGAQMCSVFVKTDFSLCGSVGVLTYSLQEGSPDRLAILFCNPFNYSSHSCSFALHFTQSKTREAKLFQNMFFSPSTLEHCKKAEGSAVFRAHALAYQGVQVSASMSQGCKAILRVLIEDDPQVQRTVAMQVAGGGERQRFSLIDLH